MTTTSDPDIRSDFSRWLLETTGREEPTWSISNKPFEALHRPEKRSGNWVRKWVMRSWTEWKWPSRRPQRPSRPNDVLRKRYQRMCVTPLAWYMTNGRLAEWVSASGSPKSARNRTNMGVSNFSLVPIGSKTLFWLSHNVGSIVPKEQNFKNSNERMADGWPTVYSLLKIGRFELFWGFGTFFVAASSLKG